MLRYLHDRMHIHGFWMEKNPLLRRWFLSAHKRHDIHHWALNDAGYMDRNFGIGFLVSLGRDLRKRVSRSKKFRAGIQVVCARGGCRTGKCESGQGTGWLVTPMQVARAESDAQAWRAEHPPIGNRPCG